MANLLLRKLKGRWCPGLGEQGVRAAPRRACERRSAVLSGRLSPARFDEANADGKSTTKEVKKEMVPGAGLEPARCCQRGILSPLCLPISPPGQ